MTESTWIADVSVVVRGASVPSTVEFRGVFLSRGNLLLKLVKSMVESFSTTTEIRLSKQSWTSISMSAFSRNDERLILPKSDVTTYLPIRDPKSKVRKKRMLLCSQKKRTEKI